MTKTELERTKQVVNIRMCKVASDPVRVFGPPKEPPGGCQRRKYCPLIIQHSGKLFIIRSGNLTRSPTRLTPKKMNINTKVTTLNEVSNAG